MISLRNLSQESVCEVAVNLAHCLTMLHAPRQPLLLSLNAPLGAGKTTFARAFITACYGDAAPCVIPSPTFTVTQVYECGDITIRHHDFYRLANPDEALETGWEESLQQGISLIEWAAKLQEWLPPRHLQIEMQFADAVDARHVCISSSHDEWRQWLETQWSRHAPHG